MSAGPIRVVHTVAGNLFGGVESSLETLAAHRDLSPGLDQEFAVCFEGRLSDELRRAGAMVHVLGGVRFSRPWTVWKARGKLRRVLATGRAHVVINHTCWPQILCGPTARGAGAAVVLWMHDLASGPGHWIDRRAARTPPDLVLANSQGTARTLPLLYPGVRSEVLHCPVRSRAVDRAEARDAVRAETGTPAGDVVIVSACRLEPLKGHRLLIEALSRLKDKPGWTAWIAGGVQRPHERAYLKELQRAADAGGVGGRVRFLGERGDVPRVLAAADIHCQPNVRPDSFGVAFIEALDAGLPVVSTRMGGAVEIVNDACGRLTPPGDPVALAGVLSTLIDDGETRSRLGAAGPARASALCSPRNVLPELERLLSALVVRRAVGTR